MKEEQKTFEKSNPTYYFTSRLLSRKLRDNIVRLYSFAHLTDVYAEEVPAQPKKLSALEKAYNEAIADHTFDATAHQWDDIDTRAVKYIVRLQHRFKFEGAWVKDFFSTVKKDLHPQSYETISESLEYTHGSAEVLGLMAAKVMKLPDGTLEAAAIQARAIQWINFMRDIAKNNAAGRIYFPKEDLKKFGLKDLSEEEARANPENFTKFIQKQLDRYREWQTEAEKSLSSIPERLQVPIKTTIDMYHWMANQIEKDPLIIFDKKVQPRKRRVLRHIVKNSAKSGTRATIKAAKQVRAGSKKAVPAAKAAVPVVKEKAYETTDAIIQKTEEIREKLPGSKD